jgi:hypothetical protein
LRRTSTLATGSLAATCAWTHHSLPRTPVKTASNGPAVVVVLVDVDEVVVVVDDVLVDVDDVVDVLVDVEVVDVVEDVLVDDVVALLHMALRWLSVPSSQVNAWLCDSNVAASRALNSTLVPAAACCDAVQAPQDALLMSIQAPPL